MYSEYTKNMMADFGDRYREPVCRNLLDSGLFLPAVMGQLSAESNWGQNAPGNNFAGIHSTGSAFSSGTQTLDTTEVVNGARISVKGTFATYADFDNFLKDYIRVLKLASYVNAGVYTAATPEDQVLAIARGGYSTLSPVAYLNQCRGRIEAARDLWKIGKISSSVTEPTVVDAQTATSLMAGISSAVQGSTLGSLAGQVSQTITNALNGK